jgi:hypothetical protein
MLCLINKHLPKRSRISYVNKYQGTNSSKQVQIETFSYLNITTCSSSRMIYLALHIYLVLCYKVLSKCEALNRSFLDYIIIYHLNHAFSLKKNNNNFGNINITTKYLIFTVVIFVLWNIRFLLGWLWWRILPRFAESWY